MQLLPVSDVMGRRQVVVALDSDILPNCGYTYIHEDGLSEGQVLAKAHHHYRMIRDAIPLSGLISSEQDGNEVTLEPLAKNMKMASQQPKFSQMRVMSWNVQGLGGPLWRRYKHRLRQEINKCIVGGPLDFLLIQEHHLNTFRISRYGSILPGNWDMFWSPAIGNTEVRGGVCMAISQRWISSIIQKQVVIPGRAQFVIIQEEEITWGLLNIYAPNTPTTRQQF